MFSIPAVLIVQALCEQSGPILYIKIYLQLQIHTHTLYYTLHLAAENSMNLKKVSLDFINFLHELRGPKQNAKSNNKL